MEEIIYMAVFDTNIEREKAKERTACDMDEKNIRQNKAVLSEQIYQERINFLMRCGKNQVCAIYIDVTENKMLAIESGTACKVKEDIKEPTVLEWLEGHVYPRFAYEDECEYFRKRFRRVVLLDEYENGRTQMEFHHCYYDENKQRKMYQVEVSTFRNPNNEHVEACAVWKDHTKEYIDEIIRKILYQKDYIAVGIIDPKKNEIFFRSYNLENVEGDTEKILSYSTYINEVATSMIPEQNLEILLRCSATDYIIENLKIAGQYSFQISNISNKVQRCTYYWFDKKRELILVVVDDMTKELETDAITGGLNREGFMRKTEEILEANPDREFSIIYFNIQRFRAVNDLWGYEAGDEILRMATNTLQTSFLKPLVVGRIEADRFCILIKRKNLDMEKLPELLHRTHERKNGRIEIYSRCGIYHIPVGCSLSVSDMCDWAKLAKASISNRYAKPYAVFTEEMNQEYEKRSLALMNLDEAIRKNEIQAYYQPVYDAWTHEIVSAEALARWDSSQNGRMLPNQFIPALEENGYITKMDHTIYEQVRDFQKKRRESGKPVIHVALNLSRMDLMNPEFLKDILDNTSREEYINYEVTESAYTTITEKGVEFLKNLRAQGVKLLIDDFGSGMSSFSTIRDYEFDIIKLDMGFVQKIGMDRKSNNILIALIDLAHHLDMKVIAEGVETKEQADFLKNYGCDYLQGFYFSKPISRDEFEKLLDSELDVVI